jgi:hypothetical protein
MGASRTEFELDVGYTDASCEQVVVQQASYRVRGRVRTWTGSRTLHTLSRLQTLVMIDRLAGELVVIGDLTDPVQVEGWPELTRVAAADLAAKLIRVLA